MELIVGGKTAEDMKMLFEPDRWKVAEEFCKRGQCTGSVKILPATRT